MEIFELLLNIISTASPQQLVLYIIIGILIVLFWRSRVDLKAQDAKSKDRDIELAEIKARATDQENWFKTFGGVMEAIGRLDSNIVEGDKATAKGLNLTSESIRHLTVTLQETNRGVSSLSNTITTLDDTVKTVDTGVKKIQSDNESLASKVAETLRDDFEQIGNRLETLTILITDNKDTERKAFIKLSNDLKDLVDRALPVLRDIVDECKDNKDKDHKTIELKQPETDNDSKEDKAS